MDQRVLLSGRAASLSLLLVTFLAHALDPRRRHPLCLHERIDITSHLSVEVFWIQKLLVSIIMANVVLINFASADLDGTLPTERHLVLDERVLV